MSRATPEGSSHRLRISSRALLAGAGAGLVLACADFFALWLWLPVAERGWLALRLALLLPALGALLGLGVVSIDRMARPHLRTRFRHPSRVAPLVWVGLSSPGIVALALHLFSGGRVSQLPYLPAWVVGSALGLAALLYVALRFARWFSQRSLRLSWPARLLVGAGGLALASVAAAGDRTLYPRHYESLHGVLTLIAWSTASLGTWALLPARISVRHRKATAIGAALTIALVFGSLFSDHDGRAAMLSPRASNSRSLMLVAAPALFAWRRGVASEEAVARLRAARRARHRALSDGELPRWPGAHIVLVTIDALRADHLGVYGYPRPISPELDAWSEEAVVFERAWTPTPRSSYALCSLMTGVAMGPRLEADGALPTDTLASRFSDHERYTAAFYPDGIFFHEGARFADYRRQSLGFSRHDRHNHHAEALTDAVLAELDDLRQRGEPPSFFWVHYFDVHEPYRERALGDTPVDRYDGEIRNVDRAFARLRRGLAELSRPVVLVLTADHGEEHRDHGGVYHGGSLYEEQVRVPLIISAPGLEPARVTSPVSLLDVAPTLWAMAGIEPPPRLDGIDLRPMLLDRNVRRGPIRATERGLAAVLQWPYKLIESEALGTLELFDLSVDPGERRSLGGERPHLVEELRAELAAF